MASQNHFQATVVYSGALPRFPLFLFFSKSQPGSVETLKEKPEPCPLNGWGPSSLAPLLPFRP